MSKDQWIAACEEILQRLIDEKIDEAEARDGLEAMGMLGPDIDKQISEWLAE